MDEIPTIFIANDDTAFVELIAFET